MNRKPRTLSIIVGKCVSRPWAFAASIHEPPRESGRPKNYEMPADFRDRKFRSEAISQTHFRPGSFGAAGRHQRFAADEREALGAGKSIATGFLSASLLRPSP